MGKLITWLLAASLAVLAGCNTMQGLGKDVKQLGDKIQKKAE